MLNKYCRITKEFKNKIFFIGVIETKKQNLADETPNRVDD
jgi:hypothetical protein